MFFLEIPANRSLDLILKIIGTHSVEAVNRMSSSVIPLRCEVNADVANLPLFKGQTT